MTTTDAEFVTHAESDAEATWHQGEGDLGARLERMLSRALIDAPAALAIGADTPGLPTAFLDEARTLLELHDAVLGPASDGGFYLIGLKSCPPGLFTGIPWSSVETFERTWERLQASGLQTHRLPHWFDVDRGQDAWRLFELVQSGQIVAPASKLALTRWAKPKD